MKVFRRLWIGDWKWRLVDAIGHLIFARYLMGPWFVQWLPDVLLPFLFLHGIISDRLMEHDALIFRAHAVLHSPVLTGLLWLAVPVMNNVVFEGVVLQWSVHCLWDMFTHENWNRETA